MIPSFFSKTLVLAVLALGVAATPVTTAPESLETYKPKPCDLVRCAGGYTCVEIDGKAKCQPTKPRPCDLVRCAGGTTCVEVNGQAQCVPNLPAETGEKCGTTTCGAGLVCCNALCGICTKPGMSCIQGCPASPVQAEAKEPAKTGVQCGPKVCGAGQECCNESCGICTAPGGFCTQQFCPPTGPKCGPKQCFSGQVCCNESCGICTAPGGFCTQQFCGTFTA